MEIIGVFIEKAKKDPVIDSGHIALYLVLLHLWFESGEPSVLGIKKEEIMTLSKISSTTTYFRKMQELKETGLIEYIPSRKRGELTSVKLKQEENDGKRKTNNIPGFT